MEHCFITHKIRFLQKDLIWHAYQVKGWDIFLQLFLVFICPLTCTYGFTNLQISGIFKHPTILYDSVKEVGRDKKESHAIFLYNP